MPTVSQIPEFVNRYAIDCAYKICDAPKEYAKGIAYKDNKIVRESKFISGTSKGVTYDYISGPKDIFVHNHPNQPLEPDSPLNFTDIRMAICAGTKKIFASTNNGFTAIDLTTAEQSPKSLYSWAYDADVETDELIKELDAKSLKSDFDFEIVSNNLAQLNTFLRTKLTAFANFSGAIFENVKWKDC